METSSTQADPHPDEGLNDRRSVLLRYEPQVPNRSKDVISPSIHLAYRLPLDQFEKSTAVADWSRYLTYLSSSLLLWCSAA